MEVAETVIRRGERGLVHLRQGHNDGFRVVGGINYNTDTLQFKYDKKYVGLTIEIIYHDADGRERSYNKTLEKNCAMSWVNENAIENTNFGSIFFSCNEEVFFEFGLG